MTNFSYFDLCNNIDTSRLWVGKVEAASQTLAQSMGLNTSRSCSQTTCTGYHVLHPFCCTTIQTAVANKAFVHPLCVRVATIYVMS